MTDIPAMDPCPADPKRGAHELSAILPDDQHGDLSLFCDRCGSIRRVPVSGALVPESLDPMSAAEIERRLFGRV